LSSDLRTILKLSATAVEKPWGGRKLERFLSADQLPEGPLGEVWLVSTVGAQESHSMILNGPHAGKSLSELIEEDRSQVLGRSVGGSSANDYPLLFKLIDADSDLSVQVHPGDSLAQEMGLGETGKEETWLILEAEPGSTVRAGFADGWDLDRLLATIRAGSDVESALQKFEVKRGDLIHIPPGTVHSIGAGILLAEIQQPSDVTFRIYDGETLGSDGLPRELHLDQASRVAQIDPPLLKVAATLESDRWQSRISVNPYQIEELRGRWSGDLPLPEKSSCIFCALEGQARLSLDGEEIDVIASGEARLVLPGEAKLSMDTLKEGWFAIFSPLNRPR